MFGNRAELNVTIICLETLEKIKEKSYNKQMALIQQNSSFTKYIIEH